MKKVSQAGSSDERRAERSMKQAMKNRRKHWSRIKKLQKPGGGRKKS